MKRAVMLLLAGGLAATWMGCTSAKTTSDNPSPTPTGSPVAVSSGDMTLVTLSVPNMT